MDLPGLDGVLSDGTDDMAPVAPVVAEPTEPEPALAAPPVAPFEGLDAWVAVGSDGGEGWWVPSGPSLVAWDVAPWEGVRTGATFTALTGDGPVEVTFAGVEALAWCGRTVIAATFSAATPVKGTVLITTELGALDAWAVTERRTPERNRRLYKVGSGAEVDIQRSGSAGRTVVENGGGRPWISSFDASALDLRRNDAPGPMWPELVAVDGEDMLLLFRIHAAMTVGWELVRIEGRTGRSLGRVDVSAAGCGS